MWIVWRQLREEQELVCDNRVLAAGGKSSAYARLLMDWECRPGVDALIAVGIAHRSCLKRRLYALLDPGLRRDTVARAGVLGTWAVGLAAALSLPFLARLGRPKADEHAVTEPHAKDEHKLADALLTAIGGALVLEALASKGALLAALLAVAGLAIGVPALRRLLPAGTLAARRGLPATILAVASRPTALSSPHPGWAEEDPAEWWRNSCAIIRRSRRLSRNSLASS